MVLTEPPPPVPSISRTSGMWSSCAICSDCTCLPPLDAAASKHEVGGLKCFHFAASAIFRAPRERADLMEAAGVEEQVDPLAYRQAAGIMLALDLVRPAHLPRERFAAA